MKDKIWSSNVRLYFLGLLGAAIIIDSLIEPLIGLHEYTSVWNLTGISIAGDPLIVFLQYPLTVGIWILAIRAIQIKSSWTWRKSYYLGFTGIAAVEEILNQYVIRLWTYSDKIAWTGSFWINLPVIILLGWITWILLGDLLATGIENAWHR
jgi:uncharacterized membrane protein